MKRKYGYRLVLIILIIGGIWSLSRAQSAYDPAYAVLAEKYPERVVVFTDRTLYAAGETLRFSAMVQSDAGLISRIRSTILYAELVNGTGNAVANGKYLITWNRSSGYMELPATLFSGIYYLRCYTRWMRNFGPQNYSYIPLCIVNPFSNQVEQGNPEPGITDLISVPGGRSNIIPSLSGYTYQPEERIEVELTIAEEGPVHVPFGCLTVVPLGTIDTLALVHEVDGDPETGEAFQFRFLPEKNGIAVTGSVLEQNNGSPAADVRIHFSILGEEPWYLVTRSDQDGRFLVNLPPRKGNLEMFVVPEYNPEQPKEVRIDNDFTSEPLPFNSASFMLNQEQYRVASRLALHMQLQQSFLTTPGRDSTRVDSIHLPVPFYGKPEFTVLLDEFVDLPNLEEVVENLVPKTYVMRREGGEYFMIRSENPMISSLPPLILIDHMPVEDMEAIMAIPPSKIDRIEVVPEVYVKGEAKFGGIISIISRQGDFAGIPLPAGSYFFDYAAVHPPYAPLQARYPGQGKIPDSRNTLHWMDHLELIKDSSYKTGFQASSVPGTYLILYRGVTDEGSLVYGLNRFEVRE